MILKEFRQMRRDHLTVALMLVVPLIMLIVFGYAARFDVEEIRTAVVGPAAEEVAGGLDAVFEVVAADATGDESSARRMLRDGDAEVVFVASDGGTEVLVDGTALFSAQSALRHVGGPAGDRVEILYNPDLSTATVTVPSILGFILLFVGLFITSLGVVRERELGTLEQFAVTPLRPADVIVGKIAPYFLLLVVNLVVATVAGIVVFGVPFRGSVLLFAVFGLVFLFVVLGFGVLVSTVARTQGEAVQLGILIILPQTMLSGMVFPLEAMPPGVRWLGSVFPLTYFIIGMRGILLKAAPLSSLWVPLVVLVAMAVVMFVLSVLRFRRDLAPRHPAGAEAGGGAAP